MKTSLRLAVAAAVGITSFFASVLGIEFVTWWWTSPSDPLLDPAINAARFAAAFAIGLGSAFLAYPFATLRGAPQLRDR